MNNKVFTNNDNIRNKSQSKSIFLLKISFILMIVACCTLIFSQNLYATNKVATGMTHTIAVTTLGTVSCVGTNAFGECDVSSWTDITQVAAGEFFSIGLDNTGHVFCAGLIDFASCDVSAFDTYSIVYIAAAPSQVVGVVSDGTAIGVGNNESGQLNLSSWTNIVEVSCGDNHTAGLKNDNTVVCEGSNFYGQCNVSSWTGISQISTVYIIPSAFSQALFFSLVGIIITRMTFQDGTRVILPIFLLDMNIVWLWTHQMFHTQPA